MDIYWKIEGVYIESRSWDEGTAQDRDTKGLLMLVCLLGPQSLGLGEKGKACPTRTFEANGEEIPGEHFGRAAPSIMFVSVLGQEPPEWSRNSVRANHTWSLSARLTEEYLRIGLPMWFIQQWLVFKPWEPIIRLYICAWVYMGVHPARGSLLRLWAAFPQLNPGTLGWMLGPDGWLRLHNEVVHMPTGDDSTAAQQQPPRSRDILRGAAPISSVGIPNMASMELVRWLERRNHRQYVHQQPTDGIVVAGAWREWHTAGRSRPSAQAGNGKEITLACCMGSKIRPSCTTAHCAEGAEGAAWGCMAGHAPAETLSCLILLPYFVACGCCDHLIRAAQWVAQARPLVTGALTAAI